MDNVERTVVASDNRTSATLRDTIGYQLRSLWLVLRNYPTLGILRRYVAYYVGRAWRAGFGARDSEDLQAIRQRFRAAASKREFTTDWFDNNIPVWVAHLAGVKARHAEPDILEVGSYEGRSTLFLLTYFPSGRATVVDLWDSGQPGADVTMISPVEARFDRNLAEHSARITKLKGRSAEVLGKLASGSARFDLIYVDGSHYSDDVIVDATLSWSLLRPGGLMIFDDYIWTDYRHDSRKSACRAINLFVRLVAGECRLLHVAHQIIVEKTSDGRRRTASVTAT